MTISPPGVMHGRWVFDIRFFNPAKRGIKYLWIGVWEAMKIRVDCYSGYRGEETPSRFWLEERLIEIKEVVDRWLDPEHRYFKVVGDDHSVYIVRHDSETYEWELIFYRREKTERETRE